MMTNEQRHEDVRRATAAAEAAMRTQTVPVNVYETSGVVVVVAPVPAVTPEDVNIELRGSTLRFWAHVRSAAPRAYLLHEWDYGGYEREVELPAGYGAGIDASLGSGQLAISVKRGDPPSGVVRATPSGT